MAIQKRTISPSDPTEFDPIFRDVEKLYNLQPGLLKALAFQESKFNPNALNKKSGAYGITQWMPDSAAYWGVNRSDPASSIEGTGRYMRHLIDMFNGDVGLALAAYNGGEGNVKQWVKKGSWRTSDNHLRPKENIEYPEKIFGHMGLSYKSPASPKDASYKLFKNGSNASLRLPNGNIQKLYSNDTFSDYSYDKLTSPDRYIDPSLRRDRRKNPLEEVEEEPVPLEEQRPETLLDFSSPSFTNNLAWSYIKPEQTDASRITQSLAQGFPFSNVAFDFRFQDPITPVPQETLIAQQTPQASPTDYAKILEELGY